MIPWLARLCQVKDNGIHANAFSVINRIGLPEAQETYCFGYIVNMLMWCCIFQTVKLFIFCAKYARVVAKTCLLR